MANDTPPASGEPTTGSTPTPWRTYGGLVGIARTTAPIGSITGM